MVKQENVLTRLLKGGRKVWDFLDQVPNCQACNGTGRARDWMYSEIVWWRGKQVHVCAACHGAGKR